MNQSTWIPFPRQTIKSRYLPPAMKLGQGYVFTRVCDSVHMGGGIPACLAGGIPACLAGLQAHTHGGAWGVWWGGGVSRSIPGWVSSPTPGGIPTCTEADPRWLLPWVVCILPECILVTMLIWMVSEDFPRPTKWHISWGFQNPLPETDSESDSSPT